MGDLVYVSLFLACCILTGGLIVLCDRLAPPAAHEQEGHKP